MRRSVIYLYLLLALASSLLLCLPIGAESAQIGAVGSISISAHVANRTGLSQLETSGNSLKEIILKTAGLSSAEQFSQYHILRLPPEGIAQVSIRYQNKRIDIYDNDQMSDDRVIVLNEGSAGLTALIDLNRYLPREIIKSQPVLVSIVYPFQ